MSEYLLEWTKTSFPRPNAKNPGIVLVELIYMNCMYVIQK